MPTNQTLTGNFNEKREARYMCTRLTFALVGAVTDEHLIGRLPPNAMITNAYVFTTVVSNAATSDVVTIGTTPTGTEIMSAGNARTLGRTGTFTAQTATTGPGRPVWVRHVVTGAKTAGELYAVIEYIELERTNGEFTPVTA